MSSFLGRGLEVSTLGDTTLVLTRAFNAPRRLVWEAMFTPEKMRRWMMPPPGWTTKSTVCEPRVGGVLKVVWKTEEADPAMTLEGEFTEVVLHERAVHTERMVLGSGEVIGSLVETHSFIESEGVTLMRITQVYPSKEERDGAVATGMNEGMEACYKKLDGVLGGAG